MKDSLKKPLQRLFFSNDPTNIYLGLCLLAPEHKQEEEMNATIVLPEAPLPALEEMLGDLIYLYFFHLSELDLPHHNSAEAHIRDLANQLFQKATGFTLEDLETDDEEFAHFIGIWDHYGGCDFCIEDRFIEYLDKLAQNLVEVPKVDILDLAKVLMVSPIEYYYCKPASLAIIGQMYYCNYASPKEVLLLLKQQNKPHELIYKDSYLIELFNWLNELDLNHLDLSYTTFETYPNNFHLFPKLHTLILSGTRTLESYEYSEGDITDAFVQLSALPDSIGSLSELTFLDLSRTQLGSVEQPATLPEWLRNFQKLETLYLPFCHLKELPIILQALPKLQYLQIPMLNLEYEGKRVWGIWCHTTDSFEELGLEWFQRLLPNAKVVTKQEELNDDDLNAIWKNGQSL